MIISCPECAGPFEVPDDRIAALVQVACPHCAFRMILDFAAANDPGLVEQGMRMASGFRSAADYHASVHAAAGLVAVEPVAAEAEAEVAEATTGEPIAAQAPVEPTPAVVELAPQPEPVVALEPPVRARPEPVVSEPPVRARPEPVVSEPPVRVRPEPVAPAPAPPRPIAPTPSVEPVRPAASVRPEPSEEARTEVHMLPRGGERLVPVDIPPVRRPPARPDDEEIAVNVPAPATEIVRTVVGPPPAPPDEVAIDFDDEDEGEPVKIATAIERPTPAEQESHPAFGSDEDEDVPTMVVAPDAREAARREMEELAARRGRTVAPDAATAVPPGRERPRPPHTPPASAAAKVAREDEAAVPSRSGERPVSRPQPDEDAETATKRPPPAVDLSTDDEVEQERMSTFGVVVVVLLLLLAGGLVTASAILDPDHSPDPRPLLEKLYRQHIKGEAPAAEAKAPAADAKADAKAPAPDAKTDAKKQ